MTSDQEVLLEHVRARLRAGIMAIVIALVLGLGLMVATLWLVIRNGPGAGQHLALLVHYFPGYQVTWAGALIGLAYGLLTGGLIGWSTAWIYNRVAGARARRRGGSAERPWSGSRAPDGAP